MWAGGEARGNDVYFDSLPRSPCPNYSHRHSESNGDDVFWSRILSGPFDEESAKAIDYSLAHLLVLCMDLKKRGDYGRRNLQESVRTWQSFVM